VPAAEVGHLGADPQCAREVLLVEPPEELVDQEVAALHHVGRLVRQQPLGPGSPAGCDRRLATGTEHQTEPEGEADGTQGLSALDLGLVAALQRPDAGVVIAGQERGSGELQQIVRAEVGDQRQPVVDGCPVPPLEGLARLLEVVDDAHRHPPCAEPLVGHPLAREYARHASGGSHCG
jgi:hypothetical protein